MGVRRLELDIYQVDAFSAEVFAGNPAAVVPLQEWLADEVLQAIAAENNLSETAFFVPAGERFHLRWFTPAVEVDLCGHATLASAYVIRRFLAPGDTPVRFDSRSGPLTVEASGDTFMLDLPARPGSEVAVPAALEAALGVQLQALIKATDWMAVLADEGMVRACTPDMATLATLDCRGVIITAAGNECDFVSRFFGPRVGVPEDPVTGSAHCTLVPYWSARLGRKRLQARQVSARGGVLECEARDDRVGVGGRAACYLRGRISI